MEVSKLEISEKLQNQGLAYEVLCWMRDHEKSCRDTNIKKIAQAMGISKDFKAHATTGSIDSTIHKLMRKGLIIRRGTNLWSSTFIVNHGHPEMPSKVDEGIIKTTKTEKMPANTIYKKNGKSIARHIREWLEAHPLSMYGTTAKELVDKIYADHGIEAKKESIYSILGNMIRDGRIERENCDYEKMKYNFYLPGKKPTEKKQVEDTVTVEEPKDDISPDTDYEVVKENKTPKEQIKVMGNALGTSRDVIWFDEYLQEKEKKMDEQTVNLPNGGTIHLTININIGK